MPRSTLACLALSAVVASCQSSERAPIQLEVGRDPDERVSFVPVAAFAEYVELPGLRNELTITLASYRASCSEFIPPRQGQTLVTVVVTTPFEQAPAPGRYPWVGLTAPTRAMPAAKLGTRGYELMPGGAITLTRVELAQQGVVEGQLAFEFAGGAERAAQRLQGRFEARICRYSRAREP